MMSCSRLSLVESDCAPLTLGPNTFAGESIELLSGAKK
jgi:hypothetical protein